METTRHAELTLQEWQRVEAWFPDLLGLPPARREAFIASHCGGDPAVRLELESLLAAADRQSVLDQPALQLPAATEATTAAAAPLPAGTTLAAWRMLRLLGRGGMGEVYLAERIAGGFEQQAAVKLLRLDAAEHAARFQLERSVLAQLQHPNIARLLDGGIDPSGRAWMAMEYIAGDRLDDYCRRRQPDLAERLELFDDVCAAVSYAHAHLVVHRDLKPANILVTPEGSVKLLDFGVAKLLDIDADTTRTGPVLLTPAHAAPEQLEGRGATVATDVYALGVLLYELLCGRRPWLDSETMVAGMVSRLARGEPGLPSRANPTGSPVPPALLRGDLDAIAMRCLRQDPGHRYATVEALREDLGRWRRHQPVAAREGAAGYVVRRWMRRHRLGFAAAALVLVALVAGLGTALWQARRAQAQAWRTELVKGVVLSAFRESDPLSRPGVDARPPARMVADAVDAAAYRLQHDPLLYAEVLGDLGEVQASLGDLAGGRATLEKALALRRADGADPDSAPTAALLRKLAVALLEAGDKDRALARAGEAQAMLLRLRLGESAEMARAQLVAAMVLVTRSERERALRLTADAQRKLEAALGRDDPETAMAVFRHGQALSQLRRDEQAVPVLRDAIARLERTQGTGSARLVPPLVALGGVLMRGHPDEAIAVYERAMRIADAELAPRSGPRARLLIRIANAYRMQGDTQRAEHAFTQALAALPEGDNGELAQLLASRGQLYLDTGRASEAATDLQRSFELRRATDGEEDGVTWYSESLWGRALRLLGRLEDAERVQREALAHLQAILGPDAYQNVLLIDPLVETLGARGKHAEAVTLARRSLALTQGSYPPGHALVAHRSTRLALALAAAGSAAQRREAGGLCRDALGALAQQKPPRDREYGEVRQRCASLAEVASD